MSVRTHHHHLLAHQVHATFDVTSQDGQIVILIHCVRGKDQMIRIERDHSVVLYKRFRILKVVCRSTCCQHCCPCPIFGFTSGLVRARRYSNCTWLRILDTSKAYSCSHVFPSFVSSTVRRMRVVGRRTCVACIVTCSTHCGPYPSDRASSLTSVMRIERGPVSTARVLGSMVHVLSSMIRCPLTT